MSQFQHFNALLLVFFTIICNQILLISCDTLTIPRLRYNTCDLDLSPEAIQLLPEECLSVEPPLKDKLKLEAELYKQFWTALDNLEVAKDLEYQRIKQEDPYGAAIPEKDWTLRYKIYEKVDLMVCQNGTEVTYDQFADCMIDKRREMIRLVELESATLVG